MSNRFEESINETLGSQGFYSSEGLYTSGTNLKLNNYRIGAGNKLYSGLDSTIQAIGSLSASTWYAIAIKESDGTISVIQAGAGGAWDNWSISGNQLNMLSLYDYEKNYCYDEISSIGHRIIGLGFTNSTPNNFEYLINIKNIPLTYIEAYSNTLQSIPNNTTTIVNYDVIDIDLNSEVTTGISWKFEPKLNISYDINGGWALDSATFVAGRSWILNSTKDTGSTTFLRLGDSRAGTNETVGINHTHYGSLNIKLVTTDDFGLLCYHNQGSPLNLLTGKSFTYINIKGNK